MIRNLRLTLHVCPCIIVWSDGAAAAGGMVVVVEREDGAVSRAFRVATAGITYSARSKIMGTNYLVGESEDVSVDQETEAKRLRDWLRKWNATVYASGIGLEDLDEKILEVLRGQN